MSAESEGREVRTVSATGGEKCVKPERLDLIPPIALEELGRVYGAGAEKYSDTNYLRGTDWRKMLGAMLRHIARWNAGEDFDPETGCHHLAHAAWHCFTLQTFQMQDIGTDDRIQPALDRGDPMGEDDRNEELRAVIEGGLDPRAFLPRDDNHWPISNHGGT